VSGITGGRIAELIGGNGGASGARGAAHAASIALHTATNTGTERPNLWLERVARGGIEKF